MKTATIKEIQTMYFTSQTFDKNMHLLKKLITAYYYYETCQINEKRLLKYNYSILNTILLDTIC